MDSNKTAAKGGPTITKDAVKRLIRDVRNIRKNPLEDNGIYYLHDEEDMLKGYALIVGPADTVYANGYYFFTFDYPIDYPYHPPHVRFCTNFGNIRFHPNMYKDGKVCLSLLNTWRGEQWTACQSISSILLTMCTLFTNDPLVFEPGIHKSHPDVPSYSTIIEFMNIDIAVLGILERREGLHIPMFDLFRDVTERLFAENHAAIRDKVTNMRDDNGPDRDVKTRMYGMNVNLKYEKLFIKIVHAVHDHVTHKTSPKIESAKTG